MNKYQKALWNIIQNLNEYSPTDNYGQDLIIIQELVDKATPMRPRIEIDDTDSEQSQYGLDYYVCPNCSSTLYEDTEHMKINDFQDSYNQDIEYCHCCSQALDWSEEND